MATSRPRLQSEYLLPDDVILVLYLRTLINLCSPEISRPGAISNPTMHHAGHEILSRSIGGYYLCMVWSTNHSPNEGPQYKFRERLLAMSG